MDYSDDNRDLLDTVNRRIIEEPFFRLLGNIQGKRVIDIGCGDGRYSQKMHQLGAAVLGVDISTPHIDVAKQQADHQLAFHCADATTLAIDEPVDLVTAMMMLNELPQSSFEAMLVRLSAWLKPHGRFICVIPHPFNFHENTIITQRTGLRTEDYFDDGKPFTTTYKDGDRIVTVTDHHYSLGYLCSQLSCQGFSIKTIVEPRLPDSREASYAIYPFYLMIEAINTRV